MTMPKWHETMRPVLEALAHVDGYLAGTDLQDAVAIEFDMTDDERAERLKSGQSRLYNRVYWGITDLEKAKLLEYGEKKGTYRITDAGRTYLSDYPGPITAKGLYENCTAFKKWKDGYQAASKAKNASEPEGVSTLEDQESPQEAMSLPTARFATRSPTTSFRSSWEKIRISSSTWSESCSWRWVTARAWTPVPTSPKRVVTRG